MAKDSSDPRAKRVLDPVERIAEVLFGLIMVLTFTGSLSIAAGREDVVAMLIGALGCNFAWGVIDALLYLMASLAEKGRNLLTFRRVLGATDAASARRHLADALPSVLVSVLQPAELDSFHARLKQLPEPPKYARLDKHDWQAAFGVFLLVFLATFPVSIPFIFMHDAALAMRVSNGIAVFMLFVTGLAYGRCIGRSPVVVGVSMVVLGLVIVAFTIALGG
jgi:VIT1/CCC1 family predicted Fe2+/Mn2+ transporter